jgi:hypothetical protein
VIPIVFFSIAARFYSAATMASPRRQRFLYFNNLAAKRAREEKVIKEYS